MRIGSRKLSTDAKYATTVSRDKRESALQSDIKSAQATNSRVLGRQSRLSRLEKPENEFQPRSASVEQGAPAPTAQPTSEQLEALAEKANQKEVRFLENFSQSLSPGEARKLTTRASESLLAMAQSGEESSPGPVLAAHSYNHAKNELNELMPGADSKAVRAAAKEDPKVQKLVGLMDSSGSYLRTARESQSQERPGETLSPTFLAQMIADRQQTMNSVYETLTRIAAERMKTAAEIHALEAQVSQEIADIYMSLFVKQAKAAAKDNQNAIYLLSGNYPRGW
ncbi:MAG: hypothetical protein KC800_03650 [Candidatus Eremiobacteraeota bacterium]|nr:hypothetical protein [Candidatus Eremiobacteraeota bacterium]